MFRDTSFHKSGRVHPNRDQLPPSVSSIILSNLGETSVTIQWTVNAYVTGQILYGTTESYGSSTTKENSFNYQTHIQNVTGLSAGTQYHFAVVGEDVFGNAYRSSDQTFTTVGVPAATTRWGSGVSFSTLSNSRIGSGTGTANTTMAAYRFRATQTADINGVRMYYLNQTNYGIGNPTVRIGVMADDGSANHYPTGTYLGTPTDFSNVGGTDQDRLFNLNAVAVTAGSLYHMIFQNTSADRTANNFSVDCWESNQPYGGYTPGRYGDRWNPIIADLDWAHMINPSGVWTLRDNFSPIMEVRYSNGEVSGLSYMELAYSNGVTYADWPLEISGTTYARQRFIAPTGGLSVIGAGVRLSKLAGSADALTLDLQNSSRASLASTAVSASVFPDGHGNASEDAPDWGYNTFAAPVALAAGSTYFLEFRCAATSRFFARGARKAYNTYDSRTYYPGYAEASQNSGTNWSGGTKIWGQATTQIVDFQYFLEVEA